MDVDNPIVVKVVTRDHQKHIDLNEKKKIIKENEHGRFCIPVILVGVNKIAAVVQGNKMSKYIRRSLRSS